MTTEYDDTTTAEKPHDPQGRMDALVIAFRWSASTLLSSWTKEAEGVSHLLWLGCIGIVGGILQFGVTLAHPITHMLWTPIYLALVLDRKTIDNMRKVLGR